MKWVRIATLVFVIALSVTLFILRDRIKELEEFGYPGIFLFSLLANATLILPMPGVIVHLGDGRGLQPLLGGHRRRQRRGPGRIFRLPGGLQRAESGRTHPDLRRLEDWMKKYGGWSPSWCWDLSPTRSSTSPGVIAGTLKMPPAKFFFWCWLGKVLKMMLFAYGGALGFSLLPD